MESEEPRGWFSMADALHLLVMLYENVDSLADQMAGC